MSAAAISLPASTAEWRPRANKWVIALAVTVGTLMGTIDTSIINVALPHLKGTLSASTSEITWVSTGYIVASVVVMPLTAWLGSVFGRKRVYMGGLVLFLIGSLFCGMASTLWTLVIFRVIQGLGAGVLQPTEQAILRETFPPHEQGQAMSLYGVAIMLGPAIGPTLGGWIIDNASWRWIFYLNLPVALLGLAAVAAVVEDPPYLVRNKASGIDWFGIVLLVAGLTCLQFLLERGEANQWFQDPKNILLAFAAAGSLLLFIAHELETPNPAVNLRLMKDRTFSSSTFISAGLMAVLFSSIFLLPLFMQELLRLDAMHSGMRLMPRSLAMFVSMPIAGMLYRHAPPRLMVAGGLTLGGFACLLMSRFTLETGTLQILLPQVLQGLAMPFIFIPLSTLGLATIAKPQMSQATGLQNLIRQIGGSLGVVAFASLLGRFIAESRVTLVSHLASNDPTVTGRIAAATGAMIARGVDPVTAKAQALRFLDMQVSGQAAVLGFDRAFALGALLFWLLIPLVLLVKVPPKDAAPATTHAEPLEV